MFEPIDYLEWARRLFGKVRFEFATSGVSAVTLPASSLVESSPAADRAQRLRASIARYNGVEDGEVVATLGTTHAMWLAYMALIEPGDDVLIEAPAYAPLACIA